MSYYHGINSLPHVYVRLSFAHVSFTAGLDGVTVDTLRELTRVDPKVWYVIVVIVMYIRVLVTYS